MSRRRGFTLAELLVLLAVIGILVSLILPAVHNAREAARRTQCLNNLKQLGIALHNYHDVHQQFPLGEVIHELDDRPTFGTVNSYMLPLFPYLELGHLADVDTTGEAYFAKTPGNATAISTPIPRLLCPSDTMGGPVSDWFPDNLSGSFGASRTNYLGFFGFDYGDMLDNVPAVFGNNYGARIAEIKDGTSHTLAMGEYLTGVGPHAQDFRGVHWSPQPGHAQLHYKSAPNSSHPDGFLTGWCEGEVNRPDLNLPCEMFNAFDMNERRQAAVASRSRHPGGVLTLRADGSGHFTSENIDLATWQALGTKDGGEIVGGF